MTKLSIHIASFVLLLLLSACRCVASGTAAGIENPAVLGLLEQARTEAAENKTAKRDRNHRARATPRTTQIHGCGRNSHVCTWRKATTPRRSLAAQLPYLEPG